MSIILKICVILLLCELAVSEGFSYENPQDWKIESPACGGEFQSPIDIETNREAEALIGDKSLKWNGYCAIPKIIRLTNTGHTIQVTPEWADESERPYLSHGPLNDEYILEQIHFHWGREDESGSEHRIDGKSYAFEIHLVHWKRNYNSFSEAAEQSDGLAVVASLHDVKKIEEPSSQALGNITMVLADVERKGMTAEITPFPISYFDVVDTTSMIASYRGSLTTPGCNEAVTWMVVMHGYPISEREIIMFRNVQLDGGDDHNNRPLQPLNEREIKFYQGK